MKQRFITAAILAGLGALVALGVVIFQFGRHNPSPPSLIDAPNSAIPGELAYMDTKGCIWRVAASGADRDRVYCTNTSDRGGPLVWFNEREIAWAQYGPTGTTWTAVDIETKQIRTITGSSTFEKDFYPGASTTSPDGRASITVEEYGKVYLIESGVRTLIADFDVARYSNPEPAIWSPDSQWIALRYYQRNELWIISKDGKTQGTIAEDASGNLSWRIGTNITPSNTGLR